MPFDKLNQPFPSTWLPKPSVPDDTYARRGEHALDWLARSTVARAQACRRFMNEHLSKLPPGTQRKMLYDLRYRWHSTFFELIVARLLQEFGASLVVEGSNREGRRPDFRAQFSDATVIVEATAPLFHAAAGEAQQDQIRSWISLNPKCPRGGRSPSGSSPRLGLRTRNVRSSAPWRACSIWLLRARMMAKGNASRSYQPALFTCIFGQRT
jgi:hypothetical protein